MSIEGVVATPVVRKLSHAGGEHDLLQGALCCPAVKVAGDVRPIRSDQPQQGAAAPRRVDRVGIILTRALLA